MYNRYIPQPDGSYRRSRMQETLQKEPDPPLPEKDSPSCTQAAPPPPPTPPKAPPCKQERCPRNKQEQKCHTADAGSFLKNLLPKDLDTGDLLIIILLLLMAGDCAEDKNTAILTLALYLFL